MSALGKITPVSGAAAKGEGADPCPMEAVSISLPQGVKTPLHRAALLFVMFLIGVVVWSGTAPLATTVRVPGKLVAADVSRKVQHLTGGRVATVNVQLHQNVLAGDMLYQFDVQKEVLRAQALRDRLRQRQGDLHDVTDLIAYVSHRWAQTGGGAETQSPHQGLLAHAKGDVGPEPISFEPANETENRFSARLNAVEARVNLLHARRGAIGSRLVTLEAEIDVRSSARSLLLRAVERAQKLQNDGAIAISRLDEQRGQLLGADAALAALRGKRADLVGQRDGFGAQETQIVRELQLQLVQERKALLDEVDGLSEDLAALALTIERAQVRAPVAGLVSALPADAPGLVVRAGEVMAVISQPGSHINVALNVPTSQIDQVFAGQQGLVALSALPQRRLPPVRVSLTGVSADPVDDPTGRSSYYLARGQINSDDLEAARAALGHDLHLAAGMPVTVSLSGPETTLLTYILSPLTAVWGNAFEE